MHSIDYVCVINHSNIIIMIRTNQLFRRYICALILTTSVVSVYADRILYIYDPSGNRVERRKEIIIRESAGDSIHGNGSLFDDLAHHRITISSNPTEGSFSVEIGGAESMDGASITIYNVSGSIIYYDDTLDSVNDIDITSCPVGIYLLVIRIEGESSSWKIIKI